MDERKQPESVASARSGRHTVALSGEVLSVRQLSKTFVGQRALDAVDFDVGHAEVHALVGHNGSGKSTMIKILAGYHRPDAEPTPTVTVNGEPLRFGDPNASRSVGLRFIHQELGLVDKLTILENLRLGATWRTRGGRILWSGNIGSKCTVSTLDGNSIVHCSLRQSVGAAGLLSIGAGSKEPRTGQMGDHPAFLSDLNLRNRFCGVAVTSSAIGVPHEHNRRADSSERADGRFDVAFHGVKAILSGDHLVTLGP